MLWLVLFAWVFGLGSLGCFGVFLWTGSFGLLDMGLEAAPGVAFDAALCFLFFCQHSILIRRPVRDALKRYFPEYCLGAIYTVTSSVALLMLVLLWQRSPVEFYHLHGWGHWLTRFVLILAFLGFFWGIRTLEKFDAFGTDAVLAHIRSQPIAQPRLTIKGPYRLVRHPFYSCAIIALWATPVLSLDRLLFNVLFTTWIVVGATLEERDLLAQFGEEYEAYRRAVPMFVPRVGRLHMQRKDEAKAAGQGTK